MSLDNPEMITSMLNADSLSPQLRTAIFLGAMAFIPAMLVTMTAFTRIVIVLSFIRRALSTQEIPPTQVIIGLALFLTLFVMGPTIHLIEQEAISPYVNKEISGSVALQRGLTELRGFMLRQTRTQDLTLFVEMSTAEAPETMDDIPFQVLVPAYVISELKTSFIMGFCIYLPFILIDLVVSIILMSLGMMMMPPVVVSTPCKLLLFILIDGWNLIARALCLSFN